MKQHLRSPRHVLEILYRCLSRISDACIWAEGLLESHVKRLNGVHVYVVGGHDDRNDDRVATLQKEGVVDELQQSSASSSVGGCWKEEEEG